MNASAFFQMQDIVINYLLAKNKNNWIEEERISLSDKEGDKFYKNKVIEICKQKDYYLCRYSK